MTVATRRPCTAVPEGVTVTGVTLFEPEYSMRTVNVAPVAPGLPKESQGTIDMQCAMPVGMGESGGQDSMTVLMGSAVAGMTSRAS